VGEAPDEMVLNIRYRIFSALARLDVNRPWTVIAAAVVLSIICVFYTKLRLEFRTGQDDLINADTRDNRNYLRYTKEFPDIDGLVIVVQAEPSPARAELFADTLAKRLGADHLNVKSVFYRIDPDLMGNRALLYLSIDDLKKLTGHVDQNLPLLRSYAAEPTLANLFAIANHEMDRAVAAMGAESGRDSTAMHSQAANASTMKNRRTSAVEKRSPDKSRVSGSPGNHGSGMDPRFFVSLLNGMLADSASNPPSPWVGLTPAGEQSGGLRDTYLASDNGKYLLLQVAQGDGAKNGPDPVEVIQGDLDAVRAQFPDVSAGMTGGPALAYAEETTTQHDMALASIIAVIGLVMLLVIPFRGIVEPAFAILALLAGVTWSFGFTTLVVGHLNLLSAVFTSVLAGIGINFPIHLMARYDEARRNGLAMRESVELAVVNTGTGVFASACIMALAFLMPMFTDFKGIAELGEVSAAGLFLCLVSALLVFPALIALHDRNRPHPSPPKLSLAPGRSTLEKLSARPGLMVGFTVAGTLAAFFLARGVTFDQNLLKLQASEAEAVRFENMLLRDSGRSSWFAVALAPNQAAAERKADAFRNLTEVSDAQTISSYIPDHQPEKRAILAPLSRKMAQVSFRMRDRTENPSALMRQLSELATKLDKMKALDSSGVAAKVSTLVQQAIAKLQSDPSGFDGYEHRIANDLRLEMTALTRQLSPGEVTATNLPPVLRERFIGTSGLYLVQIYPKGDVWADAPLRNFVTALRTVDPYVTGPPVQTYSIATVMRRGYERAAVLALIAVFVFVFADFRSLRDTLLATVPLIFGGTWLLEAMGALGWDFNLANLFAVPIIIGMGVDNGVNMLYRWREEHDKSSLILTKAVGKSVTICSLTTIAAFAALIPASHRGISSLGWTLTLGVSFILLATLIVLPALFELLGSRIDRAEGPQTLAEPPLSEAHGDSDASDDPLRKIAGVGRG
jgi:uncharacterized protein